MDGNEGPDVVVYSQSNSEVQPVDEIQPKSRSNWRVAGAGVLSTILMIAVMVAIVNAIDVQFDEKYPDTHEVIANPDGSQNEFNAVVLGDHADIDCEVMVMLTDGDSTEEIAFFECGYGDEYLFTGVNSTWHQESGNLQIIFDTPPPAGSEISVDVFPEPGDVPSLFVIVAIGMQILVFGLWLVSGTVTFIRGPREFSYGAGISAVLIYLTVIIYEMEQGCGFMC